MRSIRDMAERLLATYSAPQANGMAQALDEVGLLRPNLSERYERKLRPDDQYVSFSRNEHSESGAYIDACTYRPSMYPPSTSWVARVNVDVDGNHGSTNTFINASSEWCRQAAAILLDIANEVDRRNAEAEA